MNSAANLNYRPVVNLLDFEKVYKRLKLKYAKTLIESWPECTDPEKFVHEDIGIASFLLLLWEGEGPRTFIDLGCGNGLLVYLLVQEGHIGKGLDVRKRKIWDMLQSSNVCLKVETVVPSSASVYPEADWLIGNHSDELTAWLPIMAARSNDTCQYFTIPCCPYKLNGAKYQRKNANLSVYQDFLQYVERISSVCGFETVADKLRIPSTKRICLIGRRNKILQEVDELINKFIEEECPSAEAYDNEKWISRFAPRAAVEPVRNCTQVPKDIQYSIILSTFKLLLLAENEVKSNGWNNGGTLQLSAIAKSLPCELLEKLKLECRGLQTLLKNHHQIFLVRNGSVSLRNIDSLREMSLAVKKRSDFKWKSKSCWFHCHHPQGCPIPDKHCSYNHNDTYNNW